MPQSSTLLRWHSFKQCLYPHLEHNINGTFFASTYICFTYKKYNYEGKEQIISIFKISNRLLHSLHIPNQKWEISMDFIEGFPMSKGKDKILVMMDKLTKYSHFIGIRKTNSIQQTSEVFCKKNSMLHGFPKVIVSDRDAKFKEKFWR